MGLTGILKLFFLNLMPNVLRLESTKGLSPAKQSVKMTMIVMDFDDVARTDVRKFVSIP